MARRAGQVVEAERYWLDGGLGLWNLVALPARNRRMSPQEWKSRLSVAHKREGGGRKTVHCMTALATIPVARANKLPRVHILVASGALRIVPMTDVEIAAIMFGMAVFTAPPCSVLSKHRRMWPAVFVQALSYIGMTIEAFEPWRPFSKVVTIHTVSRPRQEAVCLGKRPWGGLGMRRCNTGTKQ